jgi:hypothetical protein
MTKKLITDLIRAREPLEDEDIVLGTDTSDTTQSQNGSTKKVSGSSLQILKDRNNLTDLENNQTAKDNLLETNNSEENQIYTTSQFSNEAKTNIPLKTETSQSRILNLDDVSKNIRCTNAVETTLIIPRDTYTNFENNSQIYIYKIEGSGDLKIEAFNDVQLNGVAGQIITIDNNYNKVILTKISTNNWNLITNTNAASATTSINDLTDTPSNKTGKAKNPLKINNAETEIEYNKEILARNIVENTGGSRSIALSDAEKLLIHNSASAGTYQIPNDSFDNLPTNSIIKLAIPNYGGDIEITTDFGVTINDNYEGTETLTGPNKYINILKRSSNRWEVYPIAGPGPGPVVPDPVNWYKIPTSGGEGTAFTFFMGNDVQTVIDQAGSEDFEHDFFGSYYNTIETDPNGDQALRMRGDELKSTSWYCSQPCTVLVVARPYDGGIATASFLVDTYEWYPSALEISGFIWEDHYQKAAAIIGPPGIAPPSLYDPSTITNDRMVVMLRFGEFGFDNRQIRYSGGTIRETSLPGGLPTEWSSGEVYLMAGYGWFHELRVWGSALTDEEMDAAITAAATEWGIS